MNLPRPPPMGTTSAPLVVAPLPQPSPLPTSDLNPMLFAMEHMIAMMARIETNLNEVVRIVKAPGWAPRPNPDPDPGWDSLTCWETPPPQACWDATNSVTSLQAPAEQFLNLQQPHQLDMPLLEALTPPRQPSPASAYGLPISVIPLPYQPVKAPLLASKPPPQVVPSSMIQERDTNMHESEKITEIHVLVDEHKAPLATTKHDLEVGRKKMRVLFNDELRLETQELVQKEDVYLCVFVGDVIMCLNRGGKIINVGVDRSHPIELSSDAAFPSTQRPCTFDPGGEISRLLLSLTPLIALWFPP